MYIVNMSSFVDQFLFVCSHVASLIIEEVLLLWETASVVSIDLAGTCPA